MGQKLSILLFTPIMIVGFQNCAKFEVDRTKASSLGGSLNGSSLTSPITCSSSQRESAQISTNCLKAIVIDKRMPANIVEYTPQFELHTDATAKRRWIYLPPNSQIDNTDPNNWIFPEGTILWKEFSVDGKKVETRQISKVRGQDGLLTWQFTNFLWREDQTDADVTVDGLTTPMSNASHVITGITDRYTVPATSTCIACHSNSAGDRSLGFSHMQLSKPKAGGFGIEDLKLRNWLTKTTVTADAIPGNDVQKAAIGYLHANCAHCHSDGGTMPSFRMNHKVFNTVLTEENVYKNTLNINSRVVPKFSNLSTVYTRLNLGTMPPPAVMKLHQVDTVGAQAIKTWIDSM